MSSPTNFLLSSTSAPNDTLAETAYHLAWRFDFTTPGFALLDLGPGVDSRTLRAWMVDLKERLSRIAIAHNRKPFLFRSLARFDQQDTTKYHLDGAPEQSMLLLGYEPSKVQSRLFLADYTRAAFDLGMTPQQYLHEHNPMFRRGEEMLSRYVTELPQPAQGHARIVLINNSSMPLSESRDHPLGVMHKAEIVNPRESERRIVNSAMLVVEGAEVVGKGQQDEFVSTETISQKVH